MVSGGGLVRGWCFASPALLGADGLGAEQLKPAVPCVRTRGSLPSHQDAAGYNEKARAHRHIHH